jgi:hypothetical protein
MGNGAGNEHRVYMGLPYDAHKDNRNRDAFSLEAESNTNGNMPFVYYLVV